MEKDIALLAWRGKYGDIDAVDAAQAGLADAIAAGVLDNMLQRAKHLETVKPEPELHQAIGLPGKELEDFIKEVNDEILRP